MTRFDLPPPPPGVLDKDPVEAVEAFLAALAAAGASPKTVKAYRAALLDFASWLRSRGRGLRGLSGEDVASWVYERLMGGLRRPRMDERRSRQATMHYYTLFLRAFLEWLGLDVKVPVVRKPRPRSPEALRPEEVERLIAAARDPLDLLIVALLFETGLRAQEAVGLRLRDIDFQRREIRVRNAKYGEERVVLYGPLTEQALALFLSTNPRGPDEPLLGISYSGLYKRLKSLARRAGLDPSRVRPHVLRHTFATEALRRGIPLPIVQRLLGHRDIKVTQVYLHIVNEDIRRAYQAAFAAQQGPWQPAAPPPVLQQPQLLLQQPAAQPYQPPQQYTPPPQPYPQYPPQQYQYPAAPPPTAPAWNQPQPYTVTPVKPGEPAPHIQGVGYGGQEPRPWGAGYAAAPQPGPQPQAGVPSGYVTVPPQPPGPVQDKGEAGTRGRRR